MEGFIQELQSIGGFEGIRGFFESGNGSIESEASSVYAGSIAWKTARGWPAPMAKAASLLASRGAATLASTIHQGVQSGIGIRPPEFTASAWVLSAALWERGWRMAVTGEVAPVCYANLDGAFGLVTEDAAWGALSFGLATDTLSEVRLVTRGFACAMAANHNSFPGPFPADGYHKPVTGGTDGATKYELADSDIVAFLPEPSRDGACRSLIPTDEAVFRLPPCATVTLVRVLEAGEWGVRGPYLPADIDQHDATKSRFRVRRRCYEVTVAF